MSAKEALARRPAPRLAPSLGKTPGARRLFVLRSLRVRALPPAVPGERTAPEAAPTKTE